MRRLLEQRQARLARCEQVLRALGPGATLERGYAIVTDASGRVLRDARDVELGATLTTRLARGRRLGIAHGGFGTEAPRDDPKSSGFFRDSEVTHRAPSSPLLR
jgi:hypothetical protein